MNLMTKRSLRGLLGLSVCVPALMLPAYAQGTQDAGEIIVTGSRIPTILDQGPSPITTISSDTIRANGYTSVPELLASMTQNSGQTQSPQSGSSADFTPGAQQVDLRGLGPNHTLVLINGRRIADFPLPYIGRSNFTDISNIPVSLIEQVEVLSGAGSAIYGSDAIAGVVNFKMKEKLDGVTLDYRHGRTQHGGGGSHRFTATGGWSTDRFSIVGGVEYLRQDPLFGRQRKIQDSTSDSPYDTTPRRTFVQIYGEYDDDGDIEDFYASPPSGNCDGLTHLNSGSVKLYERSGYGEFCGSATSIGDGTIISQRRGFNSFGSMKYEVSDAAKLFVDFQFGISTVKQLFDTTSWAFEQSSSSADNYFYNSYTGRVEDWGRQFTPEETGGFEMQRSKQTTYSITPGVRGTLGKGWDYEASFNYSRYQSVVEWPQIIASKANKLFLGDQLVGADDGGTGYPVFYANPERLFTALTREEYESISADTVYRPYSWTTNLQATVSNGELFQLPAGPVGFAAVVEVGKQGYDLRPDPLALTEYYYSWKDSDGSGKRSHAAIGGEVRVPVLPFATLTGAGRYDSFGFAGRDVGKFTYNTGLEVRPTRSVLLRAAYGTAFRAPDLHYLFTGPGNTETTVTDYYLCAVDQPADEDDCEYGAVVNRSGNSKLKAETSRSLTAGAVFAPSRNLSISVDYYRITMSDQVNDLSVDRLLRTEANCSAEASGGVALLDPNSALCRDAFDRITRFTSGANAGDVSNVAVNPINVSKEKVSGIDIAFRGSIPTNLGTFSLALGHSHTFGHDYTQYDGDDAISKLAVNSGYYIPRDKSNGSVSWDKDGLIFTLSGTRLGKLPNWRERAFVPSYTLVNASLQYDFTSHMRGSLTVRNLFDKMPVKDETWRSYPYYNTSWYDSIGRSVFLQLTRKLGGSAL